MSQEKNERYEKISQDLIRLVGGKDNIQGTAHCATRLRIVLKDLDVVDMKGIENVDLVKGVFVAGDQLQIIFGAGLVNAVYEVFADDVQMKNMSLSDLKTEANEKMNPLQRVLKALSDVFIDIMPGILAAALLTGISGVLGNMEIVQQNATLYGLNRIINISSGAIFGFLPLAVAYSACKRFGGRPILGIVIGCIMLSNSLADAYAAAQGTVDVEVLHIFGFPVELVGFQGGIIVALLIGVVTAKLDIFFERKVPEVIRLLVSPLLTTLVSALLLFFIVGPIGRGLASGITTGLVWMTQSFGLIGYAIFSGVQQLIVITGLHHVFGAIEAQLLADTGRNFLNPLMSVAIIAQGGAVLGYLARHYKEMKTKELCIPSFISVLFGITEPALFGVNIRYRYPLAGGCIGGAIGGAVVYLTNLAALGFGTTVVPGIALADPAHGGYVNYIIAHVTALAAGFIVTFILGITDKTGNGDEQTAEIEADEEVSADSKENHDTDKEEILYSPARGEVLPIDQAADPAFASKAMGDGVAVNPENGEITAPADGKISLVFPTKHAVGITLDSGVELLIHAGIDTVKMEGKGFREFVKAGERVKKGDKLITFDKELVEKSGFSPQIMFLVADAKGKTVTVTPAPKADNTTEVIRVK